MQAQRYSQLSQGVTPLVVAAALLIGAIGGYTFRGTTIRLVPAEATLEAGGASHTVLIPRAMREDDASAEAGDATHTVLIPRSVREDDASRVPQNAPIPRSVREGPEITR